MINFWLCSLCFLVMARWFSFCCLKQWFLNPVSEFWDPQNLLTFKIFLFSPTQPQFSYVCLSSRWEVTRISLGFARNKGSSQGRLGIRNLPIVPFPRTNFMKNSFSYSGAVLRNSLPCDMREVNLNDWLIWIAEFSSTVYTTHSWKTGLS